MKTNNARLQNETSEFNKYKHNRVSYDFVLSDSERDAFGGLLSQIQTSPYADYWGFYLEVNKLITSSGVPDTIRNFARRFTSTSPSQRPFWFGRNCPYDDDLPVFDWKNPVDSKRNSKRTFVCEGFLAAMSIELKIPIIAHRSVNNGDFFHDIAPKKSMASSQSQKTLKTLNFHRDFTNHFARPDYVLQIVLRSNPVNEVYSTYVSNAEIIGALDAWTLETLKFPEFHTPFDDISIQESGKDLGDAGIHAIIEQVDSVRVFEGRTVGTTPRAKQALKRLLDTMHELKVANVPEPGDFVLIRNNYSLHGKEVHQINDIEVLKQRWIMKTHNVDDMRSVSQHFESGALGVVDG